MWKGFLVCSLCSLREDLLYFVNKEVQVGHGDDRQHHLGGPGLRSKIVVRNTKLPAGTRWQRDSQAAGPTRLTPSPGWWWSRWTSAWRWGWAAGRCWRPAWWTRRPARPSPPPQAEPGLRRGRETEADRILHMISGDQDWVVLPHNILTILFQDNSKPVSPLSFKKHGFNLSLTKFYVY